MKKLISGLLIFALFSFALGENPNNPPKKTFGSGRSDTKVEIPPKKTFGSGKPEVKELPKKTEPKKLDPPKKTFGSGKPEVKELPKKTIELPKKTVVTEPKINPEVGQKPKSKFDSAAALDQRKEESKKIFIKGKEPASAYVDPRGKTVQIDPKDVRISRLREQLSEEKWQNRESRRHQVYHYYYNRPVVVYHDSYDSNFWWWLLDRSIEQQALWAYHHRYLPNGQDGMDPVRYNDMLNKNAELAARVRVLENAQVPRNYNYQPDGVDDDLMYDDTLVKAVYNPASVEQPIEHVPFDGTVLTVLLYIFLTLGIIALFIWLVFIKKW